MRSAHKFDSPRCGGQPVVGDRPAAPAPMAPTPGSARKRRPRLTVPEIKHLLWVLEWGKYIGHKGEGRLTYVGKREREKWTYPDDIAAKLRRMLPNNPVEQQP